MRELKAAALRPEATYQTRYCLRRESGVNPLAEFLLERNAALRAAAAEDLDELKDSPSWVQGTCDAVEQVVRLHVNDDPCRYQREGGCETLRLLGTMYAGDPEYRQEWRPVEWPHGQYGPTADEGEGCS